MSAEVILLPQRDKPASPYSVGFTDGMEAGLRIANERLFWRGVFAGVLVVAICVLAAAPFL